MSDQPILVTGAAGFIGSHVAARLADRGLNVVGCDNFNTYYSPQLKRDRLAALLEPRGIECLPVELANGAQVERLFDRVRPSMVLHLAAQAGVRYSLVNPQAYLDSNLVGFFHVLQAAQKCRAAHFVYASSSSVYGANRKVPFSETDRTDEPVSLYAATKKANEVIVQAWSHIHRLPATGLRFFTVYGPWGRPDMAYFDFTRRILAGQPIPVFADGMLLRDFTYIDDIAEGVVRLLFAPPATDAGVPHAVYNIGNHSPVTVLEFVRTLERVLGVDAQIEFQPMQPGDVPATFADTERLQDRVGFSPDTSLESGLQRFAQWYREWADVPQDDFHPAALPAARGARVAARA